MREDTVVQLRQPGTISEDPLTEILRLGARRLDGQPGTPRRRPRPALGVSLSGSATAPRAAQISWYCERSSRTEADSVFLSRHPASSTRVACSWPWASL